MTRRVLLAWILPLGALAGCGGGGHNNAEPTVDNGRGLTFAVYFPPRSTSRSRLIPQASESVEVRVSGNGGFSSRAVVNRPAGGGEARVSLRQLPAGSLHVTAAAYPEPGASGTAQAFGETYATATAGEFLRVVVDMQSTIARVEIGGSNDLFLGNTTTLTATARDGDGNVVLVASGAFRWQGDSDVLDIDAQSGGATARAVGTTRVTVRETESGTSGAADVRVRGVGRITLRESRVPVIAGDYADVYAEAFDTDGYSITLPDNFWAWDTNDASIATVTSQGGYGLVLGGQTGDTELRVRTGAGGDSRIPIRVYPDTVSGSLSVSRSGYNDSGNLEVTGEDVSVTVGSSATSGSQSLDSFAVSDSRTVLVELTGADDTFTDDKKVEFTLSLSGPDTENGRSFFVFADSGDTDVSGTLTPRETSQTFRLQVRDPITGDTRARSSRTSKPRLRKPVALPSKTSQTKR